MEYGDYKNLLGGRYTEYPAAISVETLCLCNANCTFCAYRGVKRKGSKLPDELIRKIIDELKDFPDDIPFLFVPCRVNEPFLDKRLTCILEEIAQHLPNVKVNLFTNGSVWSKDDMTKVIGVGNTNLVNISFNYHVKKEYEDNMGLHYEMVLDKVDTFHSLMRNLLFPFPVKISRVGDGTTQDQAFHDFVNSRWPGFESAVHPHFHWISSSSANGDSDVFACVQWFRINILADGQVAFCCIDDHGAHALGNIRTHSIREIYNAPQNRARHQVLTSRKEVTPCCRCDCRQ